MVFENGVKNIQAAAYNGARTVVSIYNKIYFCNCLIKSSRIEMRQVFKGGNY